VSIRTAVGQYLVAAAVFLVLDLVWLGVVAQPLYDRLLGDLLAPEPVVGAAVAFYALFVAGLVLFVVDPAVRAGSPRRAAATGAAFGLVTYATWDLTSLAVLRDFPAALVPVDLAWGTFLASTVSALTTLVWLRWGHHRSQHEATGS
jgi:uncharacterized membrane protein